MLRFPLIAFYFITSIRAENAENFATSRTIDDANKLPLSNRALQECVGTNCPDNDETNKDDDFFDDKKSTKKSKKESDDDDDDDDDKKSIKKSVRKSTKKSKKESVDDDFFESEDYNDDDGDDKKSTKKSVRKPTKKSKKESEDNNDDDGDDKKSTKKSVRKPMKKSKRGNDSDDYIFCGRGIGRQDCQSGQHCCIDTGDRWSYCVKDDSDSDDDHHSDDSDDDHHSDDSDDHHSGDSDDDHHSGAKDEIFTLQVWMDEIVQSTKQMMGISAFVVAGTSSDNSATVQAGKAAVQYKTAEVEMLDRDMSPDTLIMMSSVSSLITWTALTMLMDGGMFKLDDPINNALPFKVIHKQHGSIPITYRHLYSHSTGLKDVSSDYLLGTECPDDPRMPYPVGLSESLEEVISDRNIWSNSKPGKRHRYSNIATSIGALLVEGHSGVSLQEFTTKYIFEPLQMFSTQWTRPSDGSAAELYTFSKRDFHFTPGAYCLPEWPSEQLWSTAGDMAKFSRSMIKRGDLEYVTQTGADCLYSSQIGVFYISRIRSFIYCLTLSVFFALLIISFAIVPVPHLLSSQTGNLVYEESGGRDIGLGWYVGGRSYKDGAGNNGLGNGVSAGEHTAIQSKLTTQYFLSEQNYT